MKRSTALSFDGRVDFMKKDWYKSVYRRNVVDLHIPDWDDSFLSEYNAQEYVRLLKRSHSESAVIYAHSHAGLALYPTAVGYPHKALKGRNFLREVFDLCEKEDIARVLYFSLIYDTEAYERNPGWRMVDQNNTEVAADKSSRAGRYGLCCPNSEEYRKYVCSYIDEMCGMFDFEGLRFDMTFWPNVCFCHSCKERYLKETGQNLPFTIDWSSPEWVGFQRKREEWIRDFALLATNRVRSNNPDISVEHQSSTYISTWVLGVVSGLRDANDFLQGDFYMDHFQGSIARKLFSTLGLNQPYGFETSFNVDLTDHTAKKDTALLKCKVSACLADMGAFVFIDAIDPVGTMNPAPYDIMKNVFEFSTPYEKYLGGERLCDVAVYLSGESKYPYDRAPVHVRDGFDVSAPHMDALINACTAFIENNIPYTVITNKNLASLEKYKVLILPDVCALRDEECEALREYVKNGGNLFASRYASLADCDGNTHENFTLSDVFGVDYAGKTIEQFTYIAPTEKGLPLFCGATEKYPIGIHYNQTYVTAHENSEVLGRVTLPYTDPSGGRFSSIHSDPPGKPSAHPAIVRNVYGKGTSIYCAGPVEGCETQRKVFVKLVESLLPTKLIESNAPAAIEITVHKQPERMILSLVNFQHQVPVIPVNNVEIMIAVETAVSGVKLLPNETSLPYELNGCQLRFTVPYVDTLAMISVETAVGGEK